MKVQNIKRRICMITCVLILFFCSFAVAAGVEDIRVLKISPQDGRAVIKVPDGEMKIIKTGDILPVAGSGLRGASPEKKEEKGRARVVGYELRVVEIAEGRVVLEEKKGDETETVIIRLEGGKQLIERIRKTNEKQPELLAPQATRDDQKKGGKGGRFK